MDWICSLRLKQGCHQQRWSKAALLLGLAAFMPNAKAAAIPPFAPPAPAATAAPPPPAGTAPKVVNLDDWEDYLQSPTAPSRSRMFKGDDANAPFLKQDSTAPALPPPQISITTKPAAPPSNLPAPQQGSDDDRLAAIALEDQAFFQTLAKKPDTWSQEERDYRAQRIYDEYWLYLTQYPDDENATVLYGKLLRRTGQPDAAYAAFQRADQLDPNLAVVKQQIANHYAESGRYAAALEEFDKAVALAPTEPIYHFEIGELLNFYYNEFLQDKIFDVAGINGTMERELARAAALAPKQPGFAWRHAECFYEMLDPDWNAALAAWTALEKTTADPTELEVISLHRARVLIELGRLAEARKLLEAPGPSPLEWARPALDTARASLMKRLTAAEAVDKTPAPAADPAKTTP